MFYLILNAAFYLVVQGRNSRLGDAGFFVSSYCRSKVCNMSLNAGFSNVLNGCMSLAIKRVMLSVSVRQSSVTFLFVVLGKFILYIKLHARSGLLYCLFSLPLITNKSTYQLIHVTGRSSRIWLKSTGAVSSGKAR